jgi:hypothetical protein
MNVMDSLGVSIAQGPQTRRTFLRERNGMYCCIEHRNKYNKLTHIVEGEMVVLSDKLLVRRPERNLACLLSDISHYYVLGQKVLIVLFAGRALRGDVHG